GVEQKSAVDAIVDTGYGAARLGAPAACLVGDGGRCLDDNGARGSLVRAAGQRLGNAIVLRSDDAANRCRSVAERCGSADDLDLVGAQRVDRNEVVLAEIGSAACADAVLRDADAIDVEATHDRAARRAGREARSGDSGLAEQEVTQRRAAVAPD